MIQFCQKIEYLRKDNSGNAMVEMALYSPFALLLLAGTVDFSGAVSQKIQAQQAVARTLEMVSFMSLSDLNEPLLRAEAAKAAGVSESDVQARIWLECNGVEQSDPSVGCSSSNGLARYASVTISGNYQTNFYSAFANVVKHEGQPSFTVQGSLRIQ